MILITPAERGFMSELSINKDLDYNRPVRVADGIYWVGFYDEKASLHCNPYLIIDEGEAVLIDGGSRPDFPTVMMKILQVGIKPEQIKALIYQHYDPDLVGSVSNFEDTIASEDLKIISDAANNMFIRHYSTSSRLYSLEYFDHEYKFRSGRTLKFYNTPYSHSQGSIITYDDKTGVLFSSDLFGSYDVQWELFFEFKEQCLKCTDYNNCSIGIKRCPAVGIIKFHQNIMTSRKALNYAMTIVKKIPARMFAPQHGSIIYKNQDLKFLIDVLSSLEKVGIDGIV